MIFVVAWPLQATNWSNLDIPSIRSPGTHKLTSNHRQLNCLLNNLFRLASKATLEPCIIGPWWRESTQHKGPMMWKVFPCYNIIMYLKMFSVTKPSFIKIYLKISLLSNFFCPGASELILLPVRVNKMLVLCTDIFWDISIFYYEKTKLVLHFVWVVL